MMLEESSPGPYSRNILRYESIKIFPFIYVIGGTAVVNGQDLNQPYCAHLNPTHLFAFLYVLIFSSRILYVNVSIEKGKTLDISNDLYQDCIYGSWK